MIDSFGLDPLLDTEFNTVDESRYKEIVIDDSFAGNPQKVSFIHYGTNRYWRYILIANGLMHSSELKAGRIRIPIASVNKPKVKKTVESTL